MSFLKFDKDQLVNLEYSLYKELLRGNGQGAYASSSIINCNTRKYHGLLVAPQPQIDASRHVLLSSIDETIIEGKSEFNLSIHKFPGAYHPRGHKYLIDFTADPIPRLTYKVGDVIINRELVLLSHRNAILIRYQIPQAGTGESICFRPFMAFRGYHSLSKANIHANTRSTEVKNGIFNRLYKEYDPLFIQFSRQVDFVPAPDWYYNFEYIKERERGYPYHEDLFTPGYFEMPIKAGQTIFLYAGTEELDPRSFSKLFNDELKKRTPRKDFEACLRNAASQFIIKNGKKTEVLAGYHWFSRWGRDTMIALPGLLMVKGDLPTCYEILDDMVAEMQGPFFVNTGQRQRAVFNSVDAPLWFFWTLQQLLKYGAAPADVWKKYRKPMKTILEGFASGEYPQVKMEEDGLLFAGIGGFALTWMDAIIAGKPVTPRIGKPVEINALWYNALCFYSELCQSNRQKAESEKYAAIAEKTAKSFNDKFWSVERGYLLDFVDGDEAESWFMRPNQVFATSLPYSPIDDFKKESVLEAIRHHLLTPRGLRTLSPRNAKYKGTYAGTQEERDMAYHQGSVWPWLLGHYAEGLLRLHGEEAIPVLQKMVSNFEPHLYEHGLSTISELFDGDPPHTARGAISQAWSVAEILRIMDLIKRGA